MHVKPQQVCPCPESRARSFLLLRLTAPFSTREEILSLCLIPQSLPLPPYPSPFVPLRVQCLLICPSLQHSELFHLHTLSLFSCTTLPLAHCKPLYPGSSPLCFVEHLPRRLGSSRCRGAGEEGCRLGGTTGHVMGANWAVAVPGLPQPLGTVSGGLNLIRHGKDKVT